MTIYYILVAAILLLNYARRKHAISDKAFCQIVCFLFVLITGLRHNSVGSDTTGYYLAYQRVRNLSVSAVLDSRDVGYYLFEWVLAHLGLPFEVLTTLAAAMFYIPAFVLIYRYSKNHGISCLVLMAFNFFQFSMTGIRQVFAIGFSILFFLEVFNEKPHWIRAFLFIAIGTAMHRSCLAALLYIPVRMLSEKKWTNAILLVLLPITYILRTRITAFTGFFEAIGFDLEEFEGSGGGLTTYLVLLLLFVWGVLFTRRRKENDNSVQPNYLTLTGLSALLQPLVMVNSIFFRIVWYFSLYLSVYIPSLVDSSRVTPRSRVIIEVALYIGLLFMYFSITISSAHVTPYHFFWQGA